MQFRTTQLSSSTRMPLVDCSKGFLLLLLIGFLLLPQHLAVGQEKYTPEHPDVHDAATQGIEFLTKNMPLDVGESILAGIAAVEYSKRYFDKVSVDDPLVQNALDKALGAMNARVPLKNYHKIYAPCLAVVLFCSCDAEKYKPQIEELLQGIQTRQHADGGFGYMGADQKLGDTSQLQYVALAFWVAKGYGFEVQEEAGIGCLDWLCKTQQPTGSWFYTIQEQNGRYPTNGRTEHTPSIHCAGLGSVYLLGDFLNLTPNRLQNQVAEELLELDLPTSVSIHIPGENARPEAGNFDRAVLDDAKGLGNQWLKIEFEIETEQWNYYYLYALERYAYFRELSEDRVEEVPDWYDQGVEFLFSQQADSGSWPKTSKAETAAVNSAFAVMYLVRASELLVPEKRGGSMFGGRFDPPDEVNDVDDIINLINRDGVVDDWEAVEEAIKSSIAEMASRDDQSRNEQLAFLRGLMAHQDFNYRMIAVKLLAGVQDIDNAPALIYALGDPDHSIRVEAHNGLRLISRKMDSIRLPENPTDADFASVKAQWSKWYLGVNPTGKLLD